MIRFLIVFILSFCFGTIAAQTVTNGIQSCNNWLYLPTQPSAVEVGDLDIPGNQITVEALINRTTPYTGGVLYAGDIVSKHKDPSDGNYLLRPNEAEITTTNGYFKTPDICEIALNKTYHIAMVYDGNSLKFYRNGFLMSQTPATGDLVQNDWPTRIGYYFSQLFNTNLIGYINEVRIWNVARTQTQIQTYMNVSLPSPTTQAGLLAYYTFDDLLNKQGNAAWNGTLVGSASINQSNPTCSNFIPDSCCVSPQGTLTGGNICKGNIASLVFNASAGTGPFVITYSDGTNTFTQNNVQSNVPFPIANQPAANTTYSLLSIKDATSCPGSNVSGVTATVTVNACSLCTGSLGDPVINITFGSGDNPGQPLPVIVPGASTMLSYVMVHGNPAAPPPEDGQYTITNNVPANGNWFIGAKDHTPNSVDGYMAFYNASANPGEFYSQTVDNLCGSTTYEFAAWVANALDPGRSLGVDPNITFTIQQTDGTLLASYTSGDIPQTPFFTWNQYGFFFTTPATVSSVILKMVNNNPGGSQNGNDLAIDDITFRACGPTTTASFNKSTVVDSVTICEGSDTVLYATVSSGYTNPQYTWQTSIDSGKTWADIPGSNSLQLPVSTAITGRPISYKYRLMTAEGNNINSPNCRIASNLASVVVSPVSQAKLTGGDICIGQAGVLLFTAQGGAAPFSISYSSGATAFTNPSVNNNGAFPAPLPLTVNTAFTLLSVVDATGCISSPGTTTLINVKPLPQAGIAAGITGCAGDSANLSFTAGSGVAPFQVVLSDGINTTTYYGIPSVSSFKIAPLNSNSAISLVSVTDEDGNGCARTSGFSSPTANIMVKPAPQIQFDPLDGICVDKSPIIIDQAKEVSGLTGSGVFSGAGVDIAGNFSPQIAGVGTHIITYIFVAANGCFDSSSQDIVVYALPAANAGKDFIACKDIGAQLHASGGTLYAWTPPEGLSDPLIPNPVLHISATTAYQVLVTDANGCSATDSVTVMVSPAGKAYYVVPNAFTPDHNGKNDCFGIQRWGDVTLHEFMVYNRWGQLLFVTKNPGECWDGSFHGVMQSAGTYVYIIKALTPCGEVSLQGTVILIR